MIFNNQKPKPLVEFDMVQFPRFLDGRTFRNRDTYSKYLIESGYAINPNATSPTITEKPVTEESITELFDAIEAKLKNDFTPVRRRGPNKPKQGQVSDAPKTGEA